MVQHLTIDDYNCYVNCMNGGAEFEGLDRIIEHLDGCNRCKRLMSRRLMIEDVCNPESFVLYDGLSSIAAKNENRRETVNARAKEPVDDAVTSVENNNDDRYTTS